MTPQPDGFDPHGPLPDPIDEQTRNSRGSIVWSNRVVICPRCGRPSRLTLAAALRDDWDQSLTCCPLPTSPRVDEAQPLSAPHRPREAGESPDATTLHREEAESS
jgi:hypothetical protein